MITINATGDTTLHTAGKYCAEDILVKVPAGDSSGGGSIETCTITITNKYNIESHTIHYTTPDFEATSVTLYSGTIVVPKSTIITIDNWSESYQYRGCMRLYCSSGYGVFQITNNCTLKNLG